MLKDQKHNHSVSLPTEHFTGGAIFQKIVKKEET